jgi:3-oxoacyl-[acyl-carrier-protein] synthase II
VGGGSSGGSGVEAFERALYEGAGAIGADGLGAITDFAPEKWLGNKGLRVLDRSARLLCVATHMALNESGLAALHGPDGNLGDELGMVCGTLFGGLHSIVSFDWSLLTDGASYVNPMDFPNTVINSPAGQAAIKFRLRSVNSTVSAGFASGLYALHYGTDALRFGRARALLCGGVEELCEESVVGFRKARMTSSDGKVRPFHRDRDGTAPGEGSALMVLERADAARARGATPLAEIAGFGLAYDGATRKTEDDEAAAGTAAVQGALESAGVAPRDVGCIISGANGSRTADAAEARALANVFRGELDRTPVSAPKAAFGEAMGASGALCALAGALALRRQEAPPTVGAEPLPPLSLSPATQPFQGDFALVNALCCDGHNVSLVLRRAP